MGLEKNPVLTAGELPEYPEMNLQEVVKASSAIAASSENPEIRHLAEVSRDLIFHVLHLEGEIEVLEQRICDLTCDSDEEETADDSC